MATFNWVCENQSIASGILTQPSCHIKAESKLLADEKGFQQEDPWKLSGYSLMFNVYRFID